MFQKILQILFPSICLSCGYLSDSLCFSCFSKIKFSPHIREIDGLQVMSSMFYQTGSILETLIHPFKYKHQADMFRIFVPYMCRTFKLLNLHPQKLLLVAVPLHKKRRLERGYNQAELLAKWISKETGANLISCLERVKDTGVQAHLEKRKDRIKNMEGAFRVYKSIPKDSHVVLVDDIVTTGSTLLACREALQSYGIQFVSALTLANRDKNPQNPWD